MERKKKAEAAAKAADVEHRKKINNESLSDMISVFVKDEKIRELITGGYIDTGAEEICKKLIVAIIQKKIRNISVNY